MKAVFALAAVALLVVGCGDVGSLEPADADSTVSQNAEEGTVAPQPSETAPSNDGPADDGPAATEPDESPDETDTEPPDSVPSTTESTSVDRTDDSPPETVPEQTTQVVVGEVPGDLMAAILADAAERTAASTGDFVVAVAQFVQWNDGSLGCGEPGGIYTQAIVDGYWVVLELDGVGFDYRATEAGTFKLCLSPFASPPGGAPTS